MNQQEKVSEQNLVRTEVCVSDLHLLKCAEKKRKQHRNGDSCVQMVKLWSAILFK